MTQDYYYRPIEKDWGPFNLANITVFCRRMNAMLADPELTKYELYCFTSDDQKTRSNVAMLMTAFSVIALGIEADNAARCVGLPRFLSPRGSYSVMIFSPPPTLTAPTLTVCLLRRVMVETYPAYSTFPDYDGAPSGNISITSCLFAIERAIELDWYHLDTFDVEFYEVRFYRYTSFFMLKVQ